CAPCRWGPPSTAAASGAKPSDHRRRPNMDIAIVLYERFTALDAIGPYEVLSRLPGVSLAFLAAERGPITTDNGMLTVVAERSLADVRGGDIVLVPGGLLGGRRAPPHWLAFDELARLGAEPVHERVVFDGKLVTGAGVSAGIDMALSLAARVASPEVAQAIQLSIEYDPGPPFDAGSPAKAPQAVVETLRARSRFT